MPNFEFDTGLKTFTINGDESRTITFSPTDQVFIRRLGEVYSKLEAMQNKWAQAAKDAGDDIDKLLKTMDEAEKEMREAIDSVFGKPVCDTVFGDLSVYGIASGAPLWANFLFAIFDECDKELAAQEKATNPRLQRLLKKYGKK